MSDSSDARQVLIGLGVLSVAISSARLGLGALVALSESHAGTPVMIQHVMMQALVCASGLCWSGLAFVRGRATETDASTVAVFVTGQIALWILVWRYGVVHEWSALTLVLGALAVASAPGGWVLTAIGAHMDGSGHLGSAG